jgi:hypothetical protein
MKEDEDERIYHNHNTKYRSEHEAIRTTNHNKRSDNGVRHKIAYVSGPLSQWGRLLYLCSKLNKYIKQYIIRLQY